MNVYPGFILVAIAVVLRMLVKMIEDEEYVRGVTATTILKEYKILESKVMPDHIHVFIEANPFDSPTYTDDKFVIGIAYH
jgi:hypothetical protein